MEGVGRLIVPEQQNRGKCLHSIPTHWTRHVELGKLLDPSHHLTPTKAPGLTSHLSQPELTSTQLTLHFPFPSPLHPSHQPPAPEHSKHLCPPNLLRNSLRWNNPSLGHSCPQQRLAPCLCWVPTFLFVTFPHLSFHSPLHHRYSEESMWSAARAY